MKIPTSHWFEQYDCDDDNIEYQFMDLTDIEYEPDFSEYLWMEDMEEFDKNEMQRLQDEEIMKECYEAMCEDEQVARLTEQLLLMSEAGIIASPYEIEADPELLKSYLMACITDLIKMDDMCQLLSKICVDEIDVTSSKLNPLAEEFVPREIEECLPEIDVEN
ncbi:PAIP2B family protein [Megaselia abdita]